MQLYSKYPKSFPFLIVLNRTSLCIKFNKWYWVHWVLVVHFNTTYAGISASAYLRAKKWQITWQIQYLWTGLVCYCVGYKLYPVYSQIGLQSFQYFLKVPNKSEINCIEHGLLQSASNQFLVKCKHFFLQKLGTKFIKFVDNLVDGRRL